MCRVKIPFVSKESSVPVIRFLLSNGEEAYGICDSGSESTLFSKELVKKNKDLFEELPVDSMVDIVSLSNKDSYVFVEKKTNIHFEGDDKEIEVTGMLFDFTSITSHFNDITISALFGSDFLENHKAVIDYKNCYVTV